MSQIINELIDEPERIAKAIEALEACCELTGRISLQYAFELIKQQQAEILKHKCQITDLQKKLNDTVARVDKAAKAVHAVTRRIQVLEDKP